MAANEKTKLKMSTAFFEAVNNLVIYTRRPCWPAQLYLLDKYGHTLDSVLGEMSVGQGRRPFWTCQEACWMYLLGERASIRETKDVLGAEGLTLPLHTWEYSYRDV